MAKRKTTHNLPGSIYKNGTRYWWKVKLPGEKTPKSRPLKPFGSSMATIKPNARFFAQLQTQTQGRNDEMAFREKQYDQLPDRQRELGVIQNDLEKDLTEWQYTKAQEQQLAKIAQAKDYVTRNPDGRFAPAEQQALLEQIKPSLHPKRSSLSAGSSAV